jgi:hypothetical protein
MVGWWWFVGWLVDWVGWVALVDCCWLIVDWGWRIELLVG